MPQGAQGSGVRLAVLLLGARGAGKATAARAAATALGLHLVPFSCAELAAEGHAPDALHGAFEAAQPFAPTVLLLRHFGALAAAAAGVAGMPFFQTKAGPFSGTSACLRCC